MAHAVADGAKSIEGVEVILKKAADATLNDLLTADGLALGTPENFGYMSGMVKDFFDRTYDGAQEKVFRKPFVVFISAGNDGTGALRAIERIALGYKFKTVFQPVIAKGAITEEIHQSMRRTWSYNRRWLPDGNLLAFVLSTMTKIMVYGTVLPSQAAEIFPPL